MELKKMLLKLWTEKRSTVITVLGIIGLGVIVLTSFIPDNSGKTERIASEPDMSAAESYCLKTEKRLEALLSRIDGAGDVRVYLTVGSGERYVYASEEKKSVSESKTERDEKYVLIGGASERSPLIEKVETPEIIGAVVICEGCADPVVAERMYKSVSAALGIPTSKIFVTN